MQTSRLLSLSSNSPSFGSFSSAVDLASIAARVVEELRDREQRSDSHRDDNNNNSDDDDNSNFEFAFDCPMCSPPVATADEIFCNGQIRPSNPYSGETEKVGGESSPESTVPRRRRPALRKLMSEERDATSNSSSSEAGDDLTGVPPESYCVWTPKQSRDDDLRRLSSSPSHSKLKSNSAGFSKRWKLRSLLYARSSSEGNDKLVFPAPVKKGDETASSDQEEQLSKVVVGEEGKESEETKRQPFVPYRKDMMGIIKNVNGLSRHLRPF
ncbi:hypothetical protein Rs2_24195 [Raphanus sativus]|uniref:Uncharacterized protein LOC108857449 n=1 Tax=Raphanus sativus TaxID=3726 RepID=A0A6J0NT86_RAPSA|nr:uncharacterized protein LOC108857449 [Raphanus sativus]KAJ4897401.1 hypothetical protein Rs2_24195 [Raphanus sativus]